MISYKEYEKSVFDWMMQKHEIDSTFTFSLRKKGSKGAELDYFIGTAASNYFGTTFWYIPIGFPGSSTDLFDVFFSYTKENKLSYYFEIVQTRSPEESQNILALEFVKILKLMFKNEFANYTESPETNKMEWCQISGRNANGYDSLENLFSDLDKDIEKAIKLVDNTLDEFKLKNPDFTGHRISEQDFLEFMNKKTQRFERFGNIENIEMEEETKDLTANRSSQNFPLNQILYGPPGTGKTYHSVNHAVAIIENKPLALIESEPRVEVFKRFETYQEKNLVRFVTFHQSFSYEDFVEGIKPIIIGEADDRKVIYEIEDGVFKKIAKDAESISKLVSNPQRKKLNLNEEILNKVSFYKTSLGNSNNTDDDIIYDYCKENNVIAVGWGDDIDFTKTKSEKEVIDTFLQDKDYKSTDYAIVAIKCLKFWMKQNDIVFISNGNTRVRAIAQITGDYFFKVDSEIRYNQFRPVKWLATDLDISVELVYEKRFSMQTIYMMTKSQIKKEFFLNKFKEEAKEAIQNHVLIIDEINRGNVSQIFGELITLLEADKRSGIEQGMPMKITLPYSKKEFSVPANLYIIGTMNTADRSVEALDTALRRRFSFEEMPPKYDLDELNYLVAGETANHILDTINKRIEKLLDKDHLIGHSFFIKKSDESGVEKMLDAFYKNIIPLLQEYFYGDYGKIGLILGKGFIRKKGNIENLVFAYFADYDSSFDDRIVYEIIDYRKETNDTFEDALKTLLKK